MKKYEYKTVLADEILQSHSPDALLNEMGEEGWKMVAHGIHRADVAHDRFIFVRKKEEDDD